MSFLKFIQIPLLALLACAPLSAGEITFVYPAEGASIPDVQKTFIFGNISPASMPFTINGEKIAVHTNGAFIAYVQVSSGDFTFTGALADGTTAQRLVKVKGPAPKKSGDEKVWLAFANDAFNTEVLPSEYIKVQVYGTPSREAEFSIDGITKDEPMMEVPAGSGRYTGAYRVKDADAGLEGAIRARFKAGLFGNSAEVQAKGRVKVLKAETLMETSTDTVILRNAPEGGYLMFLPRGVKLVTNGLANGQRRVVLSADETGWVDEAKVITAPVGQYPVAPFTDTSSIHLKKTDYGTQASIVMYDRVPYSVEETLTGLRLTLYYANLHTNWVIYDSSDTFVKNVAFRQAGTTKAEIDFETGADPVWGYNVFYSGKNLQVEMRRRPVLSPARGKPLSGLVVVLDPGHSPYLKCENNTRRPLHEVRFSSLPASAHCTLDGAVGPKETFEVDVNLAIALKLKSRLAELGADVRMIRSGDDNVDLPDRPKLAKDLGGDIFLSVHNNALGDGEDPFAQPRGFQVYYYQRQSRELAARIHEAYVKNIPLPDEGLRYGDYLVARLTWMPAVLTESAYMIIPRQEEQLNTPAFQEQLASAMAEGVVNYFAAPGQSRLAAEQPKKAQGQNKKAPKPAKAAAPKKTQAQTPVKTQLPAKAQPEKPAAQAKKVKNAQHT